MFMRVNSKCALQVRPPYTSASLPLQFEGVDYCEYIVAKTIRDADSAVA